MKVDHKEVAKYYIECELDNIIAGEDIKLHNGLSDWPRLLEALSFTFRANSVFDFVMSYPNAWEKREVDADQIKLTGMRTELTKLIYSPEINRSPQKLIDFIQQNPGDPRLASLEVRTVPANRQTLILRQQNEELWLLDGSHRFLSMLAQGTTKFMAFIVTPNSDVLKPFVGDTIFLRLREFWRHSTDESFKKSIEETAAGIARESVNGRASIQKYWIDDAPNGDIRKVGKKILSTAEIEQDN